MLKGENMDKVNYELKYSNVRELRSENKLTQLDIAKVLDIDHTTYSQYETEKVLIPITTLNTLANYYNVSLDYLVNLNSCKNYSDSKDAIDKDITKIRLLEVRKENKLYQETLANMLGMVKSVICDCEKGRKILALEPAYILCIKYNLSMDWLYGKIDSPKYLT